MFFSCRLRTDRLGVGPPGDVEQAVDAGPDGEALLRLGGETTCRFTQVILGLWRWQSDDKSRRSARLISATAIAPIIHRFSSDHRSQAR